MGHASIHEEHGVDNTLAHVHLEGREVPPARRIVQALLETQSTSPTNRSVAGI
jgi:hypothetical protein